MCLEGGRRGGNNSSIIQCCSRAYGLLPWNLISVGCRVHRLCILYLFYRWQREVKCLEQAHTASQWQNCWGVFTMGQINPPGFTCRRTWTQISCFLWEVRSWEWDVSYILSTTFPQLPNPHVAFQDWRKL